MSDGHIDCVQRIPETEIVGILDTNEVALERVKHKYEGTRTYSEPRQFYAEAAPSVVHILTPTQTHQAVALEAMDRGCDVLLEKPMAANAIESARILDGATRLNRSLALCHNFLFLPCVQRALAMLNDGSLGDLVGVDISWRPPNRGFHVGWTKELPGGAMHEVLPHAIYLQRAFIGNPVDIAGIIRHGDARGPDCEIRILMDGESGTSHIEVSPSGEPKQFLMIVEGTKMSLRVDLSTNTLVKIRKPGSGKLSKALMNFDLAAQLIGGTFSSAVSVLRSDICNGHFPLIKAFYESLESDSDMPVTAKDGHDTTKILDAVWATSSASDISGSKTALAVG